MQMAPHKLSALAECLNRIIEMDVRIQTKFIKMENEQFEFCNIFLFCEIQCDQFEIEIKTMRHNFHSSNLIFDIYIIHLIPIL